jgi:hypothetical protein
VAVGSDLTNLAGQLQRIRAENEQIRVKLDVSQQGLPARLEEIGRQMKRDGRTDADIKKTLAKTRRDFEEQFNKKRQELDRSERQNLEKFHKARSQFFARLYHESFHAYLENYVYPHQTHTVPYWLNEGLAMMYEGGVLENDTLRVDAPNAEALKKLKDDLRHGTALPLEKLLAAGPSEFLPRHNTPAPAADRYYAHAWGLVYYLTFEKHLLGGPKMDQYVRPGDRDQAAGRFEALVGTQREPFEKQWHAAMLRLR